MNELNTNGQNSLLRFDKKPHNFLTNAPIFVNFFYINTESVI